MSTYSAEPVPNQIDSVTAEYLNRQFTAIGVALSPEGQVMVPSNGIVPRSVVEGGIVYVPNDGLYACLKTEADGVAEWMKIVTVATDTPEVDLSGKTWDDFA